MEKQESTKNHAPKSTIGEAISDEVREKMFRQAEENESAAAAQPGSPDQQEETPVSPPVELKPAEIPPTEIKSETVKADEDIEAEMQRLMDEELSKQKEPGGDTKPLSPEEEKIEQEMLRMIDEEMEKKPEQPRPEITSEIIKETALKVHETYMDAKDSGISDQEATIKAKEKLNELTQNNPKLKTRVLIEFRETAQISRQQKNQSSGPENLPVPSPVEEPAQPPVLETPAEITPTETETEEEERLWREQEVTRGNEPETEEEKKTRQERERAVLEEFERATGGGGLELEKEPIDESVSEIVNIYNKGAADREDQGEFRQKYRPQRFGTTNVMERRRSIGTPEEPPPDFETAGDGDYYAVAIEGQSNKYAVTPRFDMAFQEANFGPGGMGEVFDVPGYDPRERYLNVQIEKPAIFELDQATKKWRLIEKGRLNLKPEPVQKEKTESLPPPTTETKPMPEAKPKVESSAESTLSTPEPVEAKPPLSSLEEESEETKSKKTDQLPQEVEEEIAKMPEEEKKKVAKGLNNFGLFIEEGKNKFFAAAINYGAGKLDEKGAAGRFLSSLAESFSTDAENARKRIDNKAITTTQKVTKAFSSTSYTTRDLLKYGRVALDIVGYTAVASPIGFVTKYFTTVGLFAARGFDAMKEARLKNEEVIEKTRLQDIEAAANEAWKIYNATQAKTEGKDVSKEDLERAYKENLPDDLLRRLKENPEPGVATGIIQKFTQRHIEKSAGNLQEKLNKVEQNQKMSAQEKEYEKEKLFTKYSKRLKDFDRILSQYGVVDTAAMLAKYGEFASKTLVYGAMAESLVLGIEKLWSHLAGTIGEKPDVHLAALEKGLGISFKDGIDQTEFDKMAKHLAQLQKEGRVEEVDSIRKTYGGMEVKGTNRTVEEALKGISKKKPSAETPAMPETPTPPELPKTQVKNPWENMIDSEKVGVGSDSVWKSTKEYFLYQSPDQLKEMGFSVPRELQPGVSNPEFGPALDKWAETQTANLIDEWTKTHGGHSPDIVHSGDKVRIEFDTENRPHLKILNAAGQEIEPPAAPSTEIKPEQPPMSDEEMKALEEKLQQEVMKEDLPAPTETETPHVETPLVETPKTPLAELTEKLKETESLIGNQETKITNAVKEYTADVINSEKYTGLRIEGEKLNTFAHMFPMKGIANRIEDIDTPDKLAQAVEAFNNKLHLATETLIKGEMKDLTARESIFPVESMDGARIYFAKPLGNNEWQMLKTDSTGQIYQNIQNPFKRFWAGDKLKFNLKDVTKILGYKVSHTSDQLDERLRGVSVQPPF